MKIRNKFDRLVFLSVMHLNEYGLTEFTSKDVVVDVGAHIGAFSLAAFSRGAQWLYSIEPVASNYALLQENLEGTTATTLQAAITRNDWVKNEPVFFEEDPINFGAGKVSIRGTAVQALPFDKLVSSLGIVHLLKLDVEGAEYSILYSSNELAHVQEIVGEYHHFEGANVPPSTLVPGGPEGAESMRIPFLEAHLEANGYRFASVQHGPVTGIFHAVRPEFTPRVSWKLIQQAAAKEVVYA